MRWAVWLHPIASVQSDHMTFCGKDVVQSTSVHDIVSIEELYTELWAITGANVGNYRVNVG